jgi:hypothetical protein
MKGDGIKYDPTFYVYVVCWYSIYDYIPSTVLYISVFNAITFWTSTELD